MKKHLLTIFSALIFCFTSYAQDFLGFSNSNYSGLVGTDLQPASVVDSRLKSDFNLFGTSINFNNNYIGLKHLALDYNNKMFDFSTTNYYNLNQTPFQNNLYVNNGNSKAKALYLANNIYLPSLMVNIDDKDAIALKFKVRTILNVDGIDAELADLLYNQLQAPSLWVPQVNNKRLNIQTMTWAEYGFTYGRVIKAEGKHFLKAGVTAKFIQGLDAAYFYVKDFHYQFSSDSILSVAHGDAGYGHSSNFNGSSNELSPKMSSQPSVGFDLGLVYEWRPDYLKYKYEMNGEKDLTRKDLNKYKLRVGISLLDIGRVTYKNAESQTFNPETSNWNINSLSLSSITSLDTTLNNRYNAAGFNANNNSKFTMNLPTVLTAQIDYNIWKDIYVNLTPRYAFPFNNRPAKVHEMSMISITPRWDQRHFGAFVPISYDQMGMVKVGLGLRIGPLIIGTSNILPFVTTKPIYGADFEVMLRFAVLKPRIRDRDGDHVSDDKDRCIDVPGVWEFYGCPDRDGDHVEDKDDQCPDEPGLPEFHGCPDRDGDKIPDKDDACPDVPGLPQFNGCPDTDGDGIPDKDDDCPNEAGLPQFKGCPDRDGDGVIDKLDKCPDKPGPASNNGCPELKLILVDADGNNLRTVIQNKDGSFSFDDLPADEKVRFKFLGDHTDTMFDAKVVVGGIAKKAIKDNKDGYLHFIILKTDVNVLNQQNVQDVAVKLDTVEQAIVQKAFSNLEFATGLDVIKKESFASLDDLASLLAKKPKWRLKVSGHTDNQGVPAANLKLSQKRAEAVKKYLVGKGIAPERFKVEWFGQTKPIADNKTNEGRQKNRRVEMMIIK